MAALASALSPRGVNLLKTLRATFAALDDHAKLAPCEVDDMVSTVVAHIRSWRPQIIGSERLVDLQLVPPTDQQSEIAKLRDEVEAMRPVFVAALKIVDELFESRERCGGGYPGGAHRFSDSSGEVRCPLCDGAGVHANRYEAALILAVKDANVAEATNG